MNSIPRYAEIAGTGVKPGGTKATDLRTWISGDKEGADNIVQVFLTRENIATWQVEMHVTDLDNKTTEVFENSYSVDPFAKDPWRTSKDKNYFWREHPFENPVTFVRGATTMIEGAIDLSGMDLTHLAAIQAAADPAAIEAQRHSTAALINLLSRPGDVIRRRSSPATERP